MRAFLLAALLAICPALAMAIEEPAFDVEQHLDGVEIRQYAPYVVAQVTIAAPADEAGNQAFPILAGYIFGKNKGARSLEMTAPVTQTPAPVKMAMTAPVTQANYDEHFATLQAVMRAAGLRWSGEPTYSRYDPPITPWFLRRNEIWLTLDP